MGPGLLWKPRFLYRAGSISPIDPYPHTRARAISHVPKPLPERQLKDFPMTLRVARRLLRCRSVPVDSLCEGKGATHMLAFAAPKRWAPRRKWVELGSAIALVMLVAGCGGSGGGGGTAGGSLLVVDTVPLDGGELPLNLPTDSSRSHEVRILFSKAPDGSTVLDSAAIGGLHANIRIIDRAQQRVRGVAFLAVGRRKSSTRRSIRPGRPRSTPMSRTSSASFTIPTVVSPLPKPSRPSSTRSGSPRTYRPERGARSSSRTAALSPRVPTSIPRSSC